ncbi:hypothetical protein [Intrasporangium sp.]|jgi:hypothetical protein|uniref:hypothetical protein n=1 Tax=Intrasporangium sp. TaxID=1925024 RepID=UPI0033654246
MTSTEGKPAAGGGTDDKGNGVPWNLLFIAAIAIAVVYIVVAFITLNRADDADVTESAWLRIVFVVQGVEAIAFTAIGWLFGREVHRGAAEAAKEQADEAKQEAVGAAERATVAERDGWRLAEAIRARAEVQAPVPGPGGNERGSDDDQPSPDGGLAGLKSLADSLFPPA